MDPITAFFVGLVTLLGLAIATLVCVQRPLHDILLELCGAPHRARFWTRFFDAALLLSVLFFCLWAPPRAGVETVPLTEILGMLRAGLFGLLCALALLALIMLIGQSRFERGELPARPLESIRGPE